MVNTMEYFKKTIALTSLMPEQPTIEPMKDGPYVVTNITKFTNSKGEHILCKRKMALCRCGGSKAKPFCDGTHGKIGFKDNKLPEATPQDRKDFGGREITISDNEGVCSHSSRCDGNLPKVFWKFENNKRIPLPDNATKDELIRVIKLCPSGALAYKLQEKLYHTQERQPGISIRKDGPLQVVGYPLLKDNKPDSPEHYTLCRCGGSKNKPFCDGSHWYIRFSDKKN